ncbi:hypothetical protein SK128_013886 [Halocaridina rubra]|uniref:Mini-chromosome maintenance complex-binding protein n=1 Tax=Halocaridina rubra TaxID=373956 RepID=A0AAN8XJB6_HALRR
MPGLDDWTLTPHRIIEKYFEECGASGEWKENTKEFFTNELTHESVLNKIPWVNETPLHHLRPNQLVRFRGMIQDMFDNEFYLDIYEVRDVKTGASRLRPGRYKDIAECGVGEEIITDSPQCQPGDRLNYYCIPLPGENEWVKEIYREKNPIVDEGSTSASNARLKRSIGEEDQAASSGASVDDVENMEDTSSEAAENKRIRVSQSENGADGEASTSTILTASNSINLNFPIPGMKGTPCMLKIYGDQTFSLNDVVEVIGILSIDPALVPTPCLEEDSPGMGNMDIDEEAVHSLPPSLVPRIHALTVRSLPHTNPLLPFEIDTESTSIIGDIREAREVLRQILEEAFLGDSLAAELVICHLLSSVYIRQDVIALGKYSINLSGISKALQDQGYTSKLNQLISTLVTRSHLLTMTLSNMNTTTFIPKKDYKANRLESGLLQLSKHTHFLVDETALTAGQLDAKGVQNLTALGNVINWQKLDYDFQFHQIEQPTNIPVLLLSEGKSMISCDARISLSPTHMDVATAFNKVESKLTPEVLMRIRGYLTAVRLFEYDLSEDMQKMVQDDFVETRKNDSSISAEDLHNLLTLARLVSISCGQHNLTLDVWKSTKILENERKMRINSP